MKTWGVEFPGDDREDTMPPASDTEDVLREYPTDCEFLNVAVLLEFRQEKSSEVRRDDSTINHCQFHAYIV